MRLKRSVKVWLAEDILEVVHKKFMQQRTALEIYTASGRSFLLNLYSTAAVRKVVQYFGDKFRTSSNQSIQPWTKQWRAGQLSNFEYLMVLNKYSGRSYNDLGQYPVFPWVLANYTEPLTFCESDFRDLGWPIGSVLEPVRQDHKECYEQFEADPTLIPYHYGTHYSSVGVVIHYLVRMEPFTRQAIAFQDNHFDVADRLFYSLQVAWENSTTSTGDNKELIPEFFYLPECLLNLHSYNFGWRQTGQTVDNVELPCWADTQDAMSPYNFVYWHRRALEHPSVSRNLHKWVDLIFGWRHEDKASVNVFLPLTYEHHFKAQLALYDSLQHPRETLLLQIHHFGQSPSKLFDKPHEARTLDRREAGIFKNFDAESLIEEGNSVRVRKSTSAMLQKNDSTNVIAILVRKAKSCVVFEQANKLLASTFNANQPDLLKHLSLIKEACELQRIVEVGSLPIANCFAFTESRILIACRFADCCFKLYTFNYKASKLNLKETVHFHSAVVTCVDWSEDSVLATADLEGVIALWDVNLASRSLCTLRGVLRSQSFGIKQVLISQPLQLVMSLDLEGCIFLHDIRSCELFNVLRPETVPNYVSVSSHGLIALALPAKEPKIQIYSLNGIQTRAPLKTILGLQSLKYAEVNQDFDKDEVKWIQFSSTGDFIMAAGTLSFSIWSVHETCLPYVFWPNSFTQTVAIDPEEKQILLGAQRRDFILVRRP
jgi:hypothetical protein